jgi:hypothetical protein
MSYKKMVRWALPVASVLLVVFTLTMIVKADTLPSFLGQSNLPVYGWSVCGDLGIGAVPGVPGTFQRVLLCHGNGWEVQARCLDPGKPVPALNTVCSMINSTDFWCGDPVQQFRLFRIQQTPFPTVPASPAPSSTPTRTFTPVPSNTPTITATRPVVGTGPATSPTPGPSQTRTPRATIFTRPHPGGSGNKDWMFSLAAVAGGLVLALGALVLRLKVTPRS